MATTSTTALEQAIRTRLLTFAPMGGMPSLGTTLGTRLYIDQAPEMPTYPYGVQRLRVLTGGVDGQLRAQGMFELMLYGRPSATREAMKDAADVAVQALRDWATTSGGLIRVTGTTWQALPPFGAPADRELVAVRVTATLYVYPDFLTQYATNAA